MNLPDHVVRLFGILGIASVMTQRFELHLNAGKLCQHGGLALKKDDRLLLWLV